MSLRLDYEVHEGLKRDLSQLLSYWSTYPNKDIHTYHIISVFESCAEHFSSTKHLCSNGGLPAMEDKLSLALMFECQDRYASIDEIMQHDTGYPDIIKLTSILSGLVLLNQLEATVNDDGIVVYRLTEFGSRYAEMMLAPPKR